jgi:hypothetical protein
LISQLRNGLEDFYLAIDFQGDKLGITYTDDPDRIAGYYRPISKSGVKTGVFIKTKREIRNEALQA